MNKRAVRFGAGGGLVIALLAGVLLLAQNRTEVLEPPLFAPLSMEATPLRITVLPQTDDTNSSETILRYDGSGTSELVSSNSEGTIRLIQTNEASYTCEDDDCAQLEGITSHPLFTPSDFIYSDGDIDTLKQSLNFITESDCSVSSGTCSAWESSVQKEGQGIEIEVEKESNRIVLLRGNSPVGGATLVYEYPDTLHINTP